MLKSTAGSFANYGVFCWRKSFTQTLNRCLVHSCPGSMPAELRCICQGTVLGVDMHTSTGDPWQSLPPFVDVKGTCIGR